MAWRQKPLSWTLNNWILWKNFFCRKNWGNESNMAKKYSFLNLKKNLIINFHCIYFILKIFICCVRAQIYLGKSCSWDIGQNPLSQSDCRISPEQIDETVVFNMLIWPIWSLDSKIELTNGINLFFAYWYNFMKINLKVLGVGMVKNGCGQSCDGTLKLTVSEEWADGISWFLACWYRFTFIFWIVIVKNGCGQSGHRALKLAVSSILVFYMLLKIQES